MTPEQREPELAKQREFAALACALMMREVNFEAVDGVQQATVSFSVKEKDKPEEPKLASV